MYLQQPRDHDAGKCLVANAKKLVESQRSEIAKQAKLADAQKACAEIPTHHDGWQARSRRWLCARVHWTL